MTRIDAHQGDSLLPTVNDPGTFAWCEEVVECMNAGWAAREQGEQAFLAAVRAALQHRIWETLSPPPPQEPYTSFANLIRRTAPQGQSEGMQLVIKFSGLQEDEWGPGSTARSAALDAPTARDVSTPWAELALDATEDRETALGRRILEEFEAQLGSGAIHFPSGADSGTYEPQAVGGAASGPARMTAAQRKREKLAQTHPELLDAVQAGAMSLKQAYVEAGIEKPPQTLDRLQKLWRTATDAERERFVSWVQEQVQQARKAEYQADVYGEE